MQVEKTGSTDIESRLDEFCHNLDKNHFDSKLVEIFKILNCKEKINPGINTKCIKAYKQKKKKKKANTL